jgi:very-short-patch-repair endonuclease
MSLPERLLWQRLRGRTGLKVRRQHPIGPYIADFYVASAKIVVEIDGAAHDATMDRDARRDAYMSAQGLRILRILAADVLRDVDIAADAIFRAALPLHPAAARRGPSPHASHGAEFAGAA